MLIFLRFSEEKFCDEIVARIQSPEGVIWTDYKVRVKGYSLDAQVKLIRLLGVSPETEEDEIKRTFMEVGIGEVMESKKGWLDAGRLPGVTNGIWTLRVKILDPEMVIPSYIHRRDEGELWSLNFEGRVFCCWKCGSGYHIGDKCRDQTTTFEEIFNGNDDNEEEFVKPTWAAVVRSGQNESERNRVREIESKIKEDNQSREKERRDFENKKRLEDDEVERQRVMDALVRQKALDDVKAMAEVIVVETAAEDLSDSVGDDSESTENSDNIGQGLDTTDTVKEGGSRALQKALQHKAWMEARAAGEVGEQVTITLHPELERIFGIGATRLAMKFQGSVQNPHHLQEDESQVDGDGCFEEIEQAGEGVLPGDKFVVQVDGIEDREPAAQPHEHVGDVDIGKQVAEHVEQVGGSEGGGVAEISVEGGDTSQQDSEPAAQPQEHVGDVDIGKEVAEHVEQVGGSEGGGVSAISVEGGDTSQQDTEMLVGFLASTPLRKRSRGRKRVKSEGRVSDESYDRDTHRDTCGDTESESDDAEDAKDLIALGSSFITSGENSSSSIASGGNDSKKLKLDDQVIADEDLGEGLEASFGSDYQTGDSQGQVSDLVTGKGEDSLRDEELSSGDTGNALPPEDTKVEGMGEM